MKNQPQTTLSDLLIIKELGIKITHVNHGVTEYGAMDNDYGNMTEQNKPNTPIDIDIINYVITDGTEPVRVSYELSQIPDAYAKTGATETDYSHDGLIRRIKEIVSQYHEQTKERN